MDITREFLNNLATESAESMQTKSLNETALPDSPSPEETKLADLISSRFASDTMSQNFEGTGPQWQLEVERAYEELNRALIDAGALKMVLELTKDVDNNLHNGEYAMQRDF